MVILKYRRDIQFTAHSAIINRIIHDGVVYFFFVFSVIMWNVFSGLFAPPVYYAIPRHWGVLIVTNCAGRLVINLRRAGVQDRQRVEFQETDNPNLGSSGASSGWSWNKSAIGDIVKPGVAPSYQLSDLSTIVGATSVMGVPPGEGPDISPNERRDMEWQ
jgi:hypothetical protein